MFTPWCHRVKLGLGFGLGVRVTLLVTLLVKLGLGLGVRVTLQVTLLAHFVTQRFLSSDKVLLLHCLTLKDH